MPKKKVKNKLATTTSSTTTGGYEEIRLVPNYTRREIEALWGLRTLKKLKRNVRRRARRHPADYAAIDPDYLRVFLLDVNYEIAMYRRRLEKKNEHVQRLRQ